MQEIMNGKAMMQFHPGTAPHHALPPPHHAYMPMSAAASFSPSISPNSSVLMTPKSAGAPQSHGLISKQHQPFVLHHPTANPSPSTTITPYGQSHSAPWTAQNQFVFPSPTAMTFSTPPPLTSSSQIINGGCISHTNPVLAPQW